MNINIKNTVSLCSTLIKLYIYIKAQISRLNLKTKNKNFFTCNLKSVKSEKVY